MSQATKQGNFAAEAPRGKTCYYYARVEQSDGNLAWLSPMWITHRK